MLTGKEINNLDDYFDTSGKRLNHILDKAGFAQGRGRIREFNNFLIAQAENTPWCKDLNYTTVRAWFVDNTPSMEKVTDILQLLNQNFNFEIDINHLKVWWKLGGPYPFDPDLLGIKESPQDNSNVLDNLDDETNSRITYQVVTQLNEILKDRTEEYDIDKIISVQNATIEFVKKFQNPNYNQCPVEYIRSLILGSLLSDD